MARNRPGKRERMQARKAERTSIIAANMAMPKVERPMFGAPRGIGNSVLARDSLKSNCHDIGFVGPRGYGTPTDKVGKNEGDGGLLAPSRRSQSERESALALAATVGLHRPTQRDE